VSYLSPLHIIGYFSSETPEEITDLQKLQKQFIAEFNLYGNAPLKINEVEYSKDDILKTIQDLKEGVNLYVHRALFANKPVLAFFEKPSTLISIQPVLAFCNLMKENEGYAYFQSLLFEALHTYFKDCLSQKMYLKYKTASILTEYIDPHHKMQLYDVINDHLITLKAFVSSYPQRKLMTSNLTVRLSNDFEFIYKENFASFLNDLSDEFDNLKTELFEAFCDLISFCYSEQTVSLALMLDIIDGLSLVQGLDEATKETLRYYKKLLAGDFRLITHPSIRPYTPMEFGLEQIRNEYPSTSFLSIIRSVLSSKKTNKIVGILIFLLGTLTYLLWNGYPDTSHFLLALTLCIFLIFFLLPRSGEY
jgi:hypothetical protein